MVGCGTALLNAVHLAELLDEVAFKVPALVRVEATRHTEPAEPLINQYSGHCGCSLVMGWDGLCILRKDIGHDQDVLCPILRRLQDGEIDGQDLVWT